MQTFRKFVKIWYSIVWTEVVLWPLKEILFGWKWTFSIILLYYEAKEVNISILSQ